MTVQPPAWQTIQNIHICCDTKHSLSYKTRHTIFFGEPLSSFKHFIHSLFLLFKEGSFHLIVYFVFMYSINWAKLKLYKFSTSYKTNIRISLVILFKSHLCFQRRICCPTAWNEYAGYKHKLENKWYLCFHVKIHIKLYFRNPVNSTEFSINIRGKLTLQA